MPAIAWKNRSFLASTEKWVDPMVRGPLLSEFFISARHQAVCVSMATRYSRTNRTKETGLMSLKDHTQAGWRRYFSSSSTGTLLARRISRTRYLALEFLESRQLLSTTVTEYPTPLLGSPPSVPSQPT